MSYPKGRPFWKADEPLCWQNILPADPVNPTYCVNGFLRKKFLPFGDGTAFVKDSNRREQAIQVILSGDALQKQIEDMMWRRLARFIAKNSGLFQLGDRSRLDVKAILQGGDEVAIDEVLMNYNLLMN